MKIIIIIMMINYDDNYDQEEIDSLRNLPEGDSCVRCGDPSRLDHTCLELIDVIINEYRLCYYMITQAWNWLMLLSMNIVYVMLLNDHTCLELIDVIINEYRLCYVIKWSHRPGIDRRYYQCILFLWLNDPPRPDYASMVLIFFSESVFRWLDHTGSA